MLVAVLHRTLPIKNKAYEYLTSFDKVSTQKFLHEHDSFKPCNVFEPCSTSLDPKILLRPKLWHTVPPKSHSSGPVDTPHYHIAARLASPQSKTMAQHSEQALVERARCKNRGRMLARAIMLGEE